MEELKDNNEIMLLKGFANNEMGATELLYKNYYGVIKSLIINNSGNEDDAKDVFQESLIVLYEKLKQGHFELNCKIGTYLYSVARRLWLKRLQQQKIFHLQVEVAENQIVVDDDLALHSEKDQEFKAMTSAIHSLGEPCKGLIEAYYLQKKNMQEIAEMFGYTNTDNAKNQKYKCLMRLKKIFFNTYKKEEK